MNIVVLAKLVPDLVEELVIDPGGAKLDTSCARFILSELDDHAIEEAILLKERLGGQVTILAPDDEGIDDVLFTAAAKGADRLVKLKGVSAMDVTNHGVARSSAQVISGLKPDLVLTGVQAHNDLDGPLGALLAATMGLPYVGYVAAISVQDGHATVRKEYPGGLMAEMDVALPAVIGIQAAEQPPRYVAVSKVRQAMKSCSVEEQTVEPADQAAAGPVSTMYKPAPTQHATMLTGSPEEIAGKLVEVFRELGVI